MKTVGPSAKFIPAIFWYKSTMYSVPSEDSYMSRFTDKDKSSLKQSDINMEQISLQRTKYIYMLFFPDFQACRET